MCLDKDLFLLNIKSTIHTICMAYIRNKTFEIKVLQLISTLYFCLCCRCWFCSEGGEHHSRKLVNRGSNSWGAPDLPGEIYSLNLRHTNIKRFAFRHILVILWLLMEQLSHKTTAWLPCLSNCHAFCIFNNITDYFSLNQCSNVFEVFSYLVSTGFISRLNIGDFF